MNRRMFWISADKSRKLEFQAGYRWLHINPVLPTLFHPSSAADNSSRTSYSSAMFTGLVETIGSECLAVPRINSRPLN